MAKNRDEIIELVKNVIKDDLGIILSAELENRFKPIKDQIDLIRKENRDSYDNISTQITQDRNDINKNTVDIGTIDKKLGVIISNQNNQEQKVVNIVNEATKDIPKNIDEAVSSIKKASKNIPQNVETAVNNLVEKKSWFRKLAERFKNG